MDEAEFDRAMVAAVFDQAALRGWDEVSLVEAAQESGLDLARVRARFPGRAAVLLRFGVLADQEALAGAGRDGTPRDRLFDLIMTRFEALQRHRAGVLALMASLRTDPFTSVLLYGATLRSMAWLLETAGIPVVGVTGGLRTHGLLALWLYGLRAWEMDESADLSGTMASVDRGLDRAMRAEASLPSRGTREGPAPLRPDAPGPEVV
ncbi:MAG: hypothetical protein NVSMB18_28930 [Acetobacteraceae bacterium]